MRFSSPRTRSRGRSARPRWPRRSLAGSEAPGPRPTSARLADGGEGTMEVLLEALGRRAASRPRPTTRWGARSRPSFGRARGWARGRRGCLGVRAWAGEGGGARCRGGEQLRDRGADRRRGGRWCPGGAGGGGRQCDDRRWARSGGGDSGCRWAGWGEAGGALRRTHSLRGRGAYVRAAEGRGARRRWPAGGSTRRARRFAAARSTGSGDGRRRRWARRRPLGGVWGGAAERGGGGA